MYFKLPTSDNKYIDQNIVNALVYGPTKTVEMILTDCTSSKVIFDIDVSGDGPLVGAQ